MKEITIKATIKVLDSVNELEKEDQILLAKAKEATKTAYAPYSKFKVGAALILNNGEIFTGSNQENAAYPLCLCGERVALFAAAVQYPNEPIQTLVITATNENNTLSYPIPPCGACRQVIAESEFRNKQAIRLILQGETGPIYIINSIKDILPLTFDGDFL